MTRESVLERRLVLALCATEVCRERRRGEAQALLERADATYLLALMERLNVITLVGRRLMDLGPRMPLWLADKVRSTIDSARHHGTLMEVITLDLLARLQAAGICALPLKGAMLSRALYGDPGMRSSIDIDLLVATRELLAATHVIERMGWVVEQDRHTRTRDLPDLHHRLVHRTLPSIEIHWRIHRNETRFAGDALQRAQPSGPEGTLRMRPDDEMASLLLFWARDGFGGLRTPADIAAWWSQWERGMGETPPLDGVADSYPGLAAPLGVASVLLDHLVGVPAWRPGSLRPRARVAEMLANPFLDGGRPQLGADQALVDVVLAAPGETGAAARRHLIKVPAYRAQLAVKDGRGVWLLQAEHALRTLRRWAPRLAAAAVRVAWGRAPHAAEHVELTSRADSTCRAE